MSPYAAGLVGAILLLCGAGCTNQRDDVVRVLNASSDFGAQAEKTLEALDLKEQEEAIQHAWDKPSAEAAVKQVRARYAAAWKAYREYRLALVAAQASVNAYDAAERLGRAHDTANVMLFAMSLVDAEKAFVDASAALRGH